MIVDALFPPSQMAISDALSRQEGWLKEKAGSDIENRCVRADSQREAKNRCQGKAGIAAESACRIAQIGASDPPTIAFAMRQTCLRLPLVVNQIRVALMQALLCVPCRFVRVLPPGFRYETSFRRQAQNESEIDRLTNVTGAKVPSDIAQRPSYAVFITSWMAVTSLLNSLVSAASCFRPAFVSS